MKKLIIAVAFLITATIACKKDKGRKCLWSANINNRAHYIWMEKPSSIEIKRIEDSCACSIAVNESCVSCDVNLTDQGGRDVPCR
jgi:hypothetical protein